MLMLCRQSKPHHTWTKQWNPSVMISSVTDNCIPAIVCSTHTRLGKLNRFCSLGSTQTVHPSELYAVDRTHLHLAARFCCSASSQKVYLSELYAVYRTRLHLATRLCCSALSQTVH